MFDMKAEIALNVQSPDGFKKVLVSYPTDQQFTDWRRKKKIVQKDLGRGSWQLESSKPESTDLALVNAIRLDKEDGPQLDESEAFYILGQLADAEVNEVPERQGATFILKMKVLKKLTVSHTLRVPSVKEMMDYERTRSNVVFGKYGQQEIRVNFAASADLYDKLKVATEGYVGAAPVAHKAEAINVLLQELRADQEEAPEGDDDDQD